MNNKAKIAIINWKEFHKAGLNKKRPVFEEINGVITRGRKRGALTIEHYIFLNILRGLPPERGFSIDSKVWENAWCCLKSGLKLPNSYGIYQMLSETFGISCYEIAQFVFAA
jgi:hypothetical protein